MGVETRTETPRRNQGQRAIDGTGEASETKAHVHGFGFRSRAHMYSSLLLLQTTVPTYTTHGASSLHRPPPDGPLTRASSLVIDYRLRRCFTARSTMKSNVPSIILLNHFILIRGAAGWDEGNFTIERLGPISRRSIRSSNSK
jgi:hypothetical protein